MSKRNLTHLRVALMDTFPDFNAEGFDIVAYNERFHNSNIIIKANSNRVGYPEHWGGLSLKCAFGGNEYYESGRDFFTVNDSNYLIFNEGKYYSSFIDSEKEVNSFTINFTPELERQAYYSIIADPRQILDCPDRLAPEKFRFDERLFHHDITISPLVFELRQLSDHWSGNEHLIKERMIVLLDRMIRAHISNHNGAHLQATKASTKIELTKRLDAAREYLEAHFDKVVVLDEVADVACLNMFYFLRQFKKRFGVTPGQYLQRKRMHVAANLLRRHGESVSSVCHQVGFSDQSSFGKLFRKYYRLAPKEFREMYSRNRR